MGFACKGKCKNYDYRQAKCDNSLYVMPGHLYYYAGTKEFPTQKSDRKDYRNYDKGKFRATGYYVVSDNWQKFGKVFKKEQKYSGLKLCTAFDQPYAIEHRPSGDNRRADDSDPDGPL